MQMLQQVFRREDVLAHLDATVLFVPFTREVQQQVLRQALEKTQHSARESDRWWMHATYVHCIALRCVA